MTGLVSVVAGGGSGSTDTRRLVGKHSRHDGGDARQADVAGLTCGREGDRQTHVNDLTCDRVDDRPTDVDDLT